MIAPWPWAHQNPLAHPIRAMQLANGFSSVIPVLFEGSVIPSDQLPRHYLGKYMLITAPLPMLAIASVGLAVGLFRQVRAPKTAQSAALFVLQLWLLAPLALCALKRPNMYDGMRHFLFLLPCVGLWFGVGGVFLATRASRPRYRAAAAIAILLIAFAPAAAIVRLHPYQMTYFNSLVGGLRGAEGKYETDYWMTSYKEAMEWINSQTPASPAARVRVLAAATEQSRFCAEHCRGGNVEIELEDTYGLPGSIPRQFDYYVATYRCNMADNFPDSPIVKRIGRDGATFAVVRGRGG